MSVGDFQIRAVSFECQVAEENHIVSCGGNVLSASHAKDHDA
jgi:hypothetical protein